jgi:hypothetical protein
MRFIFLFIFVFLLIEKTYANECNQIPKRGSKNFIIGYGSLMEENSRTRTNKEAINIKPILIKNFQREWGQRSQRYKITFLTVSRKIGSSINAIYYPLNIKSIKKLDKRESGYCRHRVKFKELKFFGKKVNPKNKNFWIYTAKKNNILKPDSNHPIVQSYVDIFLNGCFQVQDKFKIYNFSKLCVETTKGWSSNWVNDRVHPRRPFLIPNFYRIDNLLSEKFSYYLNNQIE